MQLYDFYSYWRDTVGNFTTLPQHFKEHGYFTHSIGKVFHPGASSNYTDDARYSWSSIPYHPSTEQYKEAKVCLNDNGIRARNLMCPVRIIEQPQATLPDLQSLDAAIEFLHARDMKAVNNSLLPFFLAVGFHKPHIPFKYPQEYLSMCINICEKKLINYYYQGFIHWIKSSYRLIPTDHLVCQLWLGILGQI